MERDVVHGCPTSSLLKLDLEKEEYQHPLVRVDLGSAAASMLEKSSLTNDVKNKFRKECVMLLVNMLQKIKERFKHLFVRDATAFDPAEMVNNTDDAIIKAKRCIQAIYQQCDIRERIR